MLQGYAGGADDGATVMAPGKYLGPYPYEDGSMPPEGAEGVRVMSSDGRVVVMPPGRYLGPYPWSEVGESEVGSLSEALPDAAGVEGPDLDLPGVDLSPRDISPHEHSLPLGLGMERGYSGLGHATLPVYPTPACSPQGMTSVTSALKSAAPQLAPYAAFLKRLNPPTPPSTPPLDFVSLLNACRKAPRPSAPVLYKGGDAPLKPYARGRIVEVISGGTAPMVKCLFGDQTLCVPAHDVVVL